MESEKQILDLPNELNIEILKNTRLKDLVNIIKTDSYFKNLFKKHGKNIVYYILNTKGLDQNDYDAVINSDSNAIIYNVLKFLKDSKEQLHDYHLYKLLDVPATFTQEQKDKWLALVYALVNKYTEDEDEILDNLQKHFSHNDIISIIYHIHKIYENPERLEYITKFVNENIIEFMEDSGSMEYIFEDKMYEYNTWKNMPSKVQEMYAYLISNYINEGLNYDIVYQEYEFINDVIKTALEKDTELANIFQKYFPENVKAIAEDMLDNIDKKINELYKAQNVFKKHDIWNKDMDVVFDKKITEIEQIPDFVKPYIENDTEDDED
jgi:hypothetical protein